MTQAMSAKENTPMNPDVLIRQAIRKVTNIATLPQVTARIIQIVEDPNSNAQQLKKIISNDPALVTRILKVVNSAFYGLPGQINSVDRAIVMLGFGEVKQLAVAANLSSLFHGAGLGGPFAAKDLWRHCVAVGTAARELARLSRPLAQRSPEAFMAGLIHDLGLLIQLQVNPEKLSTVCAAAHEQLSKGMKPVNFCAFERNIIGVDHEQLGQAITEHWRFPEAFQQVVGNHHHPKNARSESRQIATLIYIADTLVCKNDSEFYLTARSQHLDPAEIQSLGLDQEKLDKVMEALTPLVDEAAAIFA